MILRLSPSFVIEPFRWPPLSRDFDEVHDVGIDIENGMEEHLKRVSVRGAANPA